MTIYQSKSPLCTPFLDFSIRTWEYMRRNSLSSIQLHEETITQLNLQELSLLSNNHIKIIDFSKYKESFVTGADWEWWFLHNQMNIGSAVQAKRLKNSTYDIGYIPRNGYKQILRLLDYSLNHNLLPLYIFYNYWDSSLNLNLNLNQYWRCGSFSPKTDYLGCTISHGLDIYFKEIANLNSLTDILPISFPLHCLTCCPLNSDTDSSFPGSGNPALNFFERNFNKNSDLFNTDLNPSNPDQDGGKYQKLREPFIFKEVPKRISDVKQYHDDENKMKELIKDHWGDAAPNSIIIIQV